MCADWSIYNIIVMEINKARIILLTLGADSRRISADNQMSQSILGGVCAHAQGSGRYGEPARGSSSRRNDNKRTAAASAHAHLIGHLFDGGRR